MFFNYRAEPDRMLKLFRQFHNQAQRLRKHRALYGWLLAAGCGIYLVSSFALLGLFKGFAETFLPLMGLGLYFLLAGWGLAAIRGRYPRHRWSPGGKVGVAIGLSFSGFFALPIAGDLVSVVSGATESQRELIGLLQTWAWASFGLFLASRWIVWFRMRNAAVEDFELDYLDRVLRPLLADLPPNAECSLACNPFPPIWTTDYRRDARGPYVFHSYDDMLLEFKVKLDDGSALSLRTLHRRIDKFKCSGKKTKNKGSKHRIVLIYRIHHPDLAKLSAHDGDWFRQLAGRWSAEAEGYETTLRRDPAAGKLVVVQKKKFAAPRNLAAGDLPPAALVLKTVRELSGFVASLPRPGLRDAARAA